MSHVPPPAKPRATPEQAHAMGVAKFQAAAQDVIGKDPIGPDLIAALENYTRDQQEAARDHRRPLSVLETIARAEITKLEEMVGSKGSLRPAWNAYRAAVGEALGISPRI